MTAEEFAFWDEFFGYYPFTFDRDDRNSARILAAIINDGRATRAAWAGKSTYQIIQAEDLIPDYLGKRTKVLTTMPTLEEQAQQFKAFASKLKSVSPKKSD